jgi:transcriptional regulator with XRE-family HTH domain
METGIGTKIKKIRELKNYTQEYMSDRLGVSQSTYARFEKDDSDLTVSKINKIAEVLEVSVDDLLHFNERLVFNNYNSSHINQANNIEINLPEKLIQLYEDKIKLLEEKINRLEKK